MNTIKAQKHAIPWWAAGIILGLVQVLAVSLVRPLEVSSIFVVADGKILDSIAPEYTNNHPIMANEEYKYSRYGLWFNIGIMLGAFIAILNLKSFKIQSTSIWWQHNHNAPVMLRIIISFASGVLLLLGASIAYGGLTGQFVSGLAQLSVSAIPFIFAVCVAGCLVAYYVYPNKPNKPNGFKERQ